MKIDVYTDPGCYKGDNAITEALNDFDNSNQKNYMYYIYLSLHVCCSLYLKLTSVRIGCSHQNHARLTLPVIPTLGVLVSGLSHILKL